MNEKERRDIKLAALFELRLILKKGEKKEYTLDELFDLIDTVAEAKDQEM